MTVCVADLIELFVKCLRVFYCYALWSTGPEMVTPLSMKFIIEVKLLDYTYSLVKCTCCKALGFKGLITLCVFLTGVFYFSSCFSLRFDTNMLVSKTRGKMQEQRVKNVRKLPNARKSFYITLYVG